MDWTEIKITVDADNVDRAGDIAQMVVPYGIYIEDYRTLEQEAWEIARIDLIDEDLLAKDRSKGIVHIYISPEENPNEAVSFLTERLTAEGIAHEIDENVCKNADWENNWKKYFKPMPVGERLLIRPIWEQEYDAVLLSARALTTPPAFASRALRNTLTRARAFLTSAAAAGYSPSRVCFSELTAPSASISTLSPSRPLRRTAGQTASTSRNSPFSKAR